MNIVFLDVDGVLNSMEYFNSFGKGGARGKDIDESKVLLLKEIVDKTNAKIVLSSTWRQLRDTENEDCMRMWNYLINTLSKYDLCILDVTPIINMNRPKEIKAWLKDYPEKDIKFVSLDDDFSYGGYKKYGIADCLVKTTFYGIDGGLQKEHVDMAIEILN